MRPLGAYWPAWDAHPGLIELLWYMPSDRHLAPLQSLWEHPEVWAALAHTCAWVACTWAAPAGASSAVSFGALVEDCCWLAAIGVVVVVDAHAAPAGSSTCLHGWLPLHVLTLQAR